MQSLDALGRRYGKLPSEVIGEMDQFKAFSINLWACRFGVQEEQRLIRLAERKGNHGRRR